ncbi:hypothetical protein NE236_28915 [Actinoallomurus purpureus]|uniref:hypothetical protein n=1 Tax=Actinoallomurus purpureus TaxID=478114 RepID=UPI002092F8DF|nr:hypothetical protein [Actinoallomurus purpureus]MCO6009002.1 hypothetical protein [Actinoallomurus purpureus]
MVKKLLLIPGVLAAGGLLYAIPSLGQGSVATPRSADSRAGTEATDGTAADTAPAGLAATSAQAALPGLATTKVTLPASLSYLTPGYNGTPTYTRVATAVAPDGTLRVAWPDGKSVHVTSLTKGLRRSGADTVVPKAAEVGGLVAHNGGFAVLTRRPDKNKWNETAAYLVRYQGGKQNFAAKLTSASSHDTAPTLDGSLAWNGTKYGAYFVVHGAGGFADGHFGDKLAYVSAAGKRASGGWSWGCSHNEGTALLPEKSGAFASLCAEDWRSGLFVSTGIGAPNNAPVLQREQCWAGYCGGGFGGFVRSSAGRYAAVFASRGAASAKPSGDGRGYTVKAKWATHQVAIHYLKNKSTPTGKTIYLTADPKTDHVNVHAAPYGPNRILVSWQSVANASCKSGTCTGRFTGTHLQLVDYSGRRVSKDTVVKAQIAGDIAVLPDHDVVWASVNAAPNYGRPLGTSPKSRTLTVTRLRYVG